MQPIEIPEPAPADSETVVTALETAAIFAAKGDNTEALRWLKRAVESASEGGDDERTLTLARTAAELNVQVRAQGSASAKPPNGSARPGSTASPTLGFTDAGASETTPARIAPKPPLKSGRPATSAASEATPLPRSAPPERSSPSASTSGRPPAPSSRSSAEPSSRASAAPNSRTTSSPSATRTSTLPSRSSLAPGRISALPASGALEPRPSQLPPLRTGAGARTSTTLRQFPAVRSNPVPEDSEPTAPGGPAPTPRPPALTTQRSSRNLTPAPPPIAELSPSVRGAGVPRQASEPAPASRSGSAGLRHAARVSVAPSRTDPSVFLLRVLEDGEAPPSGSAEAFVVFADPTVAVLRSEE